MYAIWCNRLCTDILDFLCDVGTRYSLKFSFFVMISLLQFCTWLSVKPLCAACSLIHHGFVSRVQREQLAAIFQLLKDNKETFGDVSEGDMEEQLRLYSIWCSAPTHLSHSETWWTEALFWTLEPGSSCLYAPLCSQPFSSPDTVLLFCFCLSVTSFCCHSTFHFPTKPKIQKWDQIGSYRCTKRTLNWYTNFVF